MALHMGCCNLGEKQVDSSVTNVALLSNSDDVTFNKLAKVLSTTSMVSPQQSGTNVKRGRGRPKKIQSTIYLAYLLLILSDYF